MRSRGITERANSILRRKAIQEAHDEESNGFIRRLHESLAERQKQRDAQRRLAEAKERRASPPNPRAASVAAAVLANSDLLFDGLLLRQRNNVVVPGELGTTQTMTTTDPYVFDLEDVGVAFVVLHLLQERGTVKITDAGTGGHWPANSGLPHVQGLVRRLAHLRSNGVFDMVVNGGVAEVKLWAAHPRDRGGLGHRDR